MPENYFGEIEGYPEETTFNSRMEIKNAGLHKYHVAGISRVLNVGCDSIVLNGDYDDEGDIEPDFGEGNGIWDGESFEDLNQNLIWDCY